MDLSRFTEEEKNAVIREFLEFFDGKVPNPVNYPKSFEFYVKMWEMHLKKESRK